MMGIGDICIINGSLISSEKIKQIHYLDTSNITNNVIDNLPKLSLDEAPSRAQRLVKDKTIIFSTVRPSLKHYGILRNPKDDMVVSTGFCTLDVKDQSSINPYYLYYLLTQPYVLNYLQNIAENNASAYPSINPSDLASLSFNFPNIYKQNQIVSLLNDIEIKLSLNRAINHNLSIPGHSSEVAGVRRAA